jgi:hypothetical protein
VCEIDVAPTELGWFLGFETTNIPRLWRWSRITVSCIGLARKGEWEFADRQLEVPN